MLKPAKCDSLSLPAPASSRTFYSRAGNGVQQIGAHLKLLDVILVIVISANIIMSRDYASGFLRFFFFDPLNAPKNVASIMMTLSKTRKKIQEEKV